MKRNPRRVQPCTPSGFVPSAADRWPSSNDSPPHNSNSVPHRFWPHLHEITRSHTALATLHSDSPMCVRLPSRDLLPTPAYVHFLYRLLSEHSTASFSIHLDGSRELQHPSLDPFNLHKSRVRRATGFLLTAFSNATPYTLFQ